MRLRPRPVLAALLTLAACGDDGTATSGGGGGSGGGEPASSSSATSTSGSTSTSTSGSTSTSTSASTGTGGDACDDAACGEGRSCQVCFDPLFPEDTQVACAPLDPTPTADEFRCGEVNCDRRVEVCVIGDYVFDELVCGAPGRCQAIDGPCEGCDCAVPQIGPTFCVESCEDDGAGEVTIEGNVYQGPCLNCGGSGAACTGNADCCALDGLDGFCTVDGVCGEPDGE